LDVDLLSSCNLTSFFVFSSFFLATNLCVKGHYFCWEITNTFFFLLSTEVACLIFLLFFSFRFDGVYFKVENIFFCQNVGIYDKRKRIYFLFFSSSISFFSKQILILDFLLISFFLLRCMH